MVSRSCFATDFAEMRDAKFKGEFVAKYVPESSALRLDVEKLGRKNLSLFPLVLVFFIDRGLRSKPGVI